jgi:hypothetical protein
MWIYTRLKRSLDRFLGRDHEVCHTTLDWYEQRHMNLLVDLEAADKRYWMAMTALDQQGKEILALQGKVNELTHQLDRPKTSLWDLHVKKEYL